MATYFDSSLWLLLTMAAYFDSLLWLLSMATYCSSSPWLRRYSRVRLQHQGPGSPAARRREGRRERRREKRRERERDGRGIERDERAPGGLTTYCHTNLLLTMAVPPMTRRAASLSASCG
eukprot:scaffold126512_cov51-Phaeocystis_antarctica.AAC.1